MDYESKLLRELMRIGRRMEKSHLRIRIMTDPQPECSRALQTLKVVCFTRRAQEGFAYVADNL